MRAVPNCSGLVLVGDVDQLPSVGPGTVLHESLGVRELNAALQRVLNPVRPGEPSVERFGWRFQMRDKVIQTENDYDNIDELVWREPCWLSGAERLFAPSTE